jgi:hypothetical protein
MTARTDTEEAVSNLSLAHLRQPPIATMADNNDRARAVSATFTAARDAALRLRWWNFATAWVSPGAATVEHPSPLKKIFPLPPDYILVRYLDGSEEEDWEITTHTADPAGSAAKVAVLITNVTAPLICYTARIEDVRLWDDDFKVAFSYLHAAFAGPQLGASASRVEKCLAAANDWRAEAATVDAQEKSTQFLSRDTSWTAARRLGGSRARR